MCILILFMIYVFYIIFVLLIFLYKILILYIELVWKFIKKTIEISFLLPVCFNSLVLSNDRSNISFGVVYVPLK